MTKKSTLALKKELAMALAVAGMGLAGQAHAAFQVDIQLFDLTEVHRVRTPS